MIAKIKKTTPEKAQKNRSFSGPQYIRNVDITINITEPTTQNFLSIMEAILPPQPLV